MAFTYQRSCHRNPGTIRIFDHGCQMLNIGFNSLAMSPNFPPPLHLACGKDSNPHPSPQWRVSAPPPNKTANICEVAATLATTRFLKQLCLQVVKGKGAGKVKSTSSESAGPSNSAGAADPGASNPFSHLSKKVVKMLAKAEVPPLSFLPPPHPPSAQRCDS